MHEYSVVQALLDACENHAKGRRVVRVSVAIGVMSGIEPDLLLVAFDTFKEQTIAHDATLTIEVQPIRIRCRECTQEGPIEPLRYRCGACGSVDVEVIEGESMYLMLLDVL